MIAAVSSVIRSGRDKCSTEFWWYVEKWNINVRRLQCLLVELLYFSCNSQCWLTLGELSKKTREQNTALTYCILSTSDITIMMSSSYVENRQNDAVLYRCLVFTLCICNCCSGMLIMAALWNKAVHYIFALLFILSSFFFFSCLISAVADWMYIILPHMVCPWDAGVKCTARCSLKIQNAKNIAKKLPSGHHHNFVGLHLRNEGM